MKLSTVDQYRNPRPVYNCAHFAARGVARRIQRFGWHNLRHWFLPPVINAISLDPIDQDFVPDEKFEISMFAENGFLHEEPLNHYVVFKPIGFTKTISINAGYLMHHFVISEALGYTELARIIKHYGRKETDPAPSVDSGVQAKSTPDNQ